MGQSITRKRPWLAAVLGALATGAGHLYLHRWRRAFGWLAVLFGVGALFVDPAALDAFVSGERLDLGALAPILVVAVLSVADAYLLAVAQNVLARRTVTADGRLTHCPNCGKELDPDLDFCQWCTADVGELADVLPERTDE